MRFNLRDGGYTEVTFYRDKQGKTHPFPQDNANIVLSRGTEESKKALEKILVDGLDSPSGRVYIAFMGPPIPPYKTICQCGHEIRVDLDEYGYYIEGASEIIFERKGSTPKAPFT